MLRWTLLWIALMVTGLPASAWALEFALDRFTVTGAISFDDTFDDGLLNIPPTSLMPDTVGTTAEAGGFRLFSDADGAAISQVPGGTLAVDTAQVAAGISSGGTSVTTIDGVWRADLPTDPTLFTSYGIGFDDPSAMDLETIFLLVRADANFAIIDLQDRTFLFGRDLIPIATFAQASSVILGLDLDHATGLVAPRYSLDGGTTFVQGSSWSTPAIPIQAFQTTPTMHAFAQGQTFTVPEPALALLVCLAGLGSLARRNAD